MCLPSRDYGVNAQNLEYHAVSTGRLMCSTPFHVTLSLPLDAHEAGSLMCWQFVRLEGQKR